jgi:chromosome segregation ATPase
MFDLVKYLNENRLSQTARLADRAKKSLNEDYNPEIPDSDQPIGSSDKTSSRVGGVQSKLAMLKKKKDELVKKFTSGQIDIHQYKQMIGNIPQQIKSLQADLDRDTMQIGDDEEEMNEIEVTEESELGQSVKKLAMMNDQIEKLSVELKKLEREHSELQKPIYTILEDLNTLHDDVDKSIKVGNHIIVSFKTKPTEVTNYKYKEAFQLLEL